MGLGEGDSFSLASEVAGVLEVVKGRFGTVIGIISVTRLTMANLAVSEYFVVLAPRGSFSEPIQGIASVGSCFLLKSGVCGCDIVPLGPTVADEFILKTPTPTRVGRSDWS